MTPEQAISAVYGGQLVQSTREEWPAVRLALQEAAARWIDDGQDVRAMIALREVRRLDALHGEERRWR